MNRFSIFASLGLALALLAGCGEQTIAPSAAPPAAPQMTVYKSPTCNCCGAWVEHMRDNGFAVTVVEEADLAPRKQQFGVPPRLGSCHTATVDGYVIEGHVPAEQVRRLLAERPAARGLAVPGMPLGSPGMEAGDRRDPYAVLLFGDGADSKVFARYPQN